MANTVGGDSKWSNVPYAKGTTAEEFIKGTDAKCKRGRVAGHAVPLLLHQG